MADFLETLRTHSHSVAEKMVNPEVVAQQLFSNGIISDISLQKVNAEATPYRKACAIVDVMLKIDISESHEEFIIALEEDNRHLIELLKPGEKILKTQRSLKDQLEALEDWTSSDGNMEPFTDSKLHVMKVQIHVFPKNLIIKSCADDLSVILNRMGVQKIDVSPGEEASNNVMSSSEERPGEEKQVAVDIIVLGEHFQTDQLLSLLEKKNALWVTSCHLESIEEKLKISGKFFSFKSMDFICLYKKITKHDATMRKLFDFLDKRYYGLFLLPALHTYAEKKAFNKMDVYSKREKKDWHRRVCLRDFPETEIQLTLHSQSQSEDELRNWRNFNTSRSKNTEKIFETGSSLVPVIGIMGSGKTYLMGRIVKSFQEHDWKHNSFDFIVFYTFREMNSQPFVKKEDPIKTYLFLAIKEKDLLPHEEKFEGVWKGFLKYAKGRGLLILDGLDEHMNHSQLFAESPACPTIFWVQKMIHREIHKNLFWKIIVTGRPYAFPRQK